MVHIPARYGRGWQALLTKDQQTLLTQAWFLLERERDLPHEQVVDFSFLVFTPAKVYEGFLKTFLYQMGLVSKQAYYNQHFRIGKALNPDLPARFRDAYWLFDDVSNACGTDLAMRLWSTWKLARNQVFHFEPGNSNTLTYEAAKERVVAILETIEAAAKGEARAKTLAYAGI